MLKQSESCWCLRENETEANFLFAQELAQRRNFLSSLFSQSIFTSFNLLILGVCYLDTVKTKILELETRSLTCKEER